MPYLGISPNILAENNLTNVQLIDDLSSQFNGSTTTFNLTSSGEVFHTVAARAIFIVLGGVVQDPSTDYSTSGGQITFTTAPQSGLSFAGRKIYGLNEQQGVNDGTVTPAKLNSGGPSWDVSGNTNIDGNLTVDGGLTIGSSATVISSNHDFPTIRPTLDINFAATKTLDRRITFTRDSLGTFTDDMGIVRYVSNNVPRFDHDPTTGESLGLLIEESRTNLVEYGDFTTGWNEYGGTATSTTETAAPDGTLTAKKITSKGDVSTAGIYDSITYSSNTTYTHTMWLKAGTVTIAGLTVNSGGKWANGDYPYITVNLSTGAVTASGGVSAKATAYPNGWYRLEATGTFGSNTQVDAIWVHSQTGSSMSGNTTDYYYVWGPQAEQGNFGTSYIPTSGSSVIRAQDTPLITGTNFTDFYNQSEGTLVLSADIGNLTASNQVAVAFEDTSNVSASFIAMGYNAGGGGSGHVGAWYNSSGATSTFKSHNIGVTINTEFRQSFAYKLDDFSSVANGNAPLTDHSGGITTLIDRVRFGNYHYGGMTSGHIRQFKYYNKRLSNAELQGLTQQ